VAVGSFEAEDHSLREKEGAVADGGEAPDGQSDLIRAHLEDAQVGGVLELAAYGLSGCVGEGDFEISHGRGHSWVLEVDHEAEIRMLLQLLGHCLSLVLFEAEFDDVDCSSAPRGPGD
jgi:hypothetical protein